MSLLRLKKCECLICVDYRMLDYLYVSRVDERKLANVLYALIRYDNSRLLDIAYHNSNTPNWIFKCQTNMMNQQLDPRTARGNTRRIKKILKYVRD